jgi:hypothetical protein
MLRARLGFAIALALPLGLGLDAAVPSPASASITGVCPDGSIFVVQRSADVPCADARRVDPHRVPPLRPENLPRPYLWQVHREKLDENNPYNLLERAEQVRALGAVPPAPGAAPPSAPPAPGSAGAGSGPAPSVPAPTVAAALPPAPPAAAPARAAELALTDGELRDLLYLVELSQQRVLATFLRPGPGGDDSLRVALAHSQAFEDRLAPAGGGAVLLFSAQAKARERFLPNFTFVQGSQTYTPRRDDPTQLGLLFGRLGELDAEQLALGYVVLPPGLDLAQPLDVYWDDRQLGATFRP